MAMAHTTPVQTLELLGDHSPALHVVYAHLCLHSQLIPAPAGLMDQVNGSH